MFRFGRKKEDAGPTEAGVREALARVIEPDLGQDLVALNLVREIRIDGASVHVTLLLASPASPHRERLERAAHEAVAALDGVEHVEIRVQSGSSTDPRIRQTISQPIHNTIAVASGKGGVGKSTVSANLAIALAQQGARVGLLDADIYGPNLPQMLGARRLPPPTGQRINPTRAQGVALMSMGFLLQPDQPVIWRGPMLHQALRQFLSDVNWGELDYLIIDMPPGTGDVQMSLAQSTPLTGGLIVTTPQQVALADARRGLATFERLEVPVIGVIENMSTFIAPDTGKVYQIFGEGGGRRYAEEAGVPFLGALPIDPRIAEGGDSGNPILVAQPDSPAAEAFRELARRVVARVGILNMSRVPEGVIGIGDIPIG